MSTGADLPQTPDVGGLPKGLSRPAIRALTGAGIHRLEQLNGMPAPEILRLHGIGRKAMETLRQALAARGMGFEPEEGG